MDTSVITVLTHLLGATLAGALIGLERTYHGRPAGFRTHVLVCAASSLLMLLGTKQAAILSGLPPESLRIDPARMAQGIMTGIGFLGAGVIMKDGLSVRGLTTAASIWITASIGVIIGAGFYLPAAMATALTLATLSLFRWLEATVPTLAYARLAVRYTRTAQISENTLIMLIQRQDISVASNTTYRQSAEGKFFDYELSIRSAETENFRRLADVLAATSEVLEFSLTPASEK
ncbi:MAG: MgtC/SapB family protein [Gammaproteobacteria bacterium]|nr:MgtC/SapB family protein [Gammaproteobacteria bacterium]